MRHIVALLLIACTHASNAQSILPPDVRKDDSWTYRGINAVAPGEHIYVTEVTHVDEKLIITVTTVTDGKDINTVKNAREIDSTWTREWNAIATHTGRLYAPHAGTFRFPIQIGSTHEIKYQILNRAQKNALVSGEAVGSVAGWETVTVPAGTFRALKVMQKGVWRRLDSGVSHVQEIAFWYVPEVKRWVKLEATNPSSKLVEELISYSLTK